MESEDLRTSMNMTFWIVVLVMKVEEKQTGYKGCERI